MGAQHSAGLSSPSWALTEFPTQVGTAAQGILMSAHRPSHCSTRWQRNHRNIYLEKESKSSDMFSPPLRPEKQAWEFPKFRLSCISGAFWVWMSQKYVKAIFGEGRILLFGFVANTGPAKPWGYKKEQGKLHAVGGCLNVWFLTWRKFTFKFWEKASVWF